MSGTPILTRRFVILGLGQTGLLGLAACAGFDLAPPKEEIVYDKRPYRPADPAAFAPLVNAYRARNGLSPVAVDATLNGIAGAYARHLAEADQMTHDLAPYGGLEKRLRDGGFNYSSAAENLGEGYRDMEAALEGWKKSPPHDRNLKLPEVTLFGLGSGFRQNSRYQAYWCLILGKPRASGPRREGPEAMQWGEPVVPKKTAEEPGSFSINGMKWPF